MPSNPKNTFKEISKIIFKEAPKAILKAIYTFIALILDDVLLIAGVAFLYYGVSTIYPPAGHITLGICLISAAFLIASRKPNKQ